MHSHLNTRGPVPKNFLFVINDCKWQFFPICVQISGHNLVVIIIPYFTYPESFMELTHGENFPFFKFLPFHQWL